MVGCDDASQSGQPSTSKFVPKGPPEPFIWEVKNYAEVKKELRESKGRRYSSTITDGKRNAWIAFLEFGEHDEKQNISYIYCGIKLVGIHGSLSTISVDDIKIVRIAADYKPLDLPVTQFSSSMAVGDSVESETSWHLSQFGEDLRLQFTVVYAIPDVGEPNQGQVNDGDASLGGIVLGDMKYADCTLISKTKKQFPCHKVILAARSAVFDTTFQTDMNEMQSGKMEIKDGEDAGISGMLSYIYKGEKPESTAADGFDNLLYLAVKYRLHGLIVHCTTLLHSELSIENAAAILVLADRYSFADLQDAAVDFIFVNNDQVSKTSGWMKLKRNYPTLHLFVIDAFFDYAKFTNRHGQIVN